MVSKKLGMNKPISKEERDERTSQTKSIVQLVAKRLFGCRWVRSLPSMSPLHIQLALRQEGSQHHRPGGTSLQTCFQVFPASSERKTPPFSG